MSNPMRQYNLEVSLEVIDQCPGFFRKLQRHLGNFRVEGSVPGYCNVINISFWSDKFKLPTRAEGERNRPAMLEARRNKRGSWYFTNITVY